MPATLLIEIGCEEIPARMIAGAAADLEARIVAILDQAGLAHGASRSLGGPRRLAVSVGEVGDGLAGGRETVTGPPATVAFGADGRPTGAAIGFARKQGIDPSALVRVETDRGVYAGFVREFAGKTVGAILAGALPAAVSGMTFPKTMRWGAGEHRWVRPVHWIVALHGARVLDLSIFGVRSGRDSRGHRFLAPAPVAVPDADAYVATLDAAKVLVDPSARRAALAGALDGAAATAGGRLVADDALLDEARDLVEWPGVVVGSFDPSFLSLPREILVTTLRHHQKSFSVERDGALLPAFLSVANTDRDPGGHVRRGNEWVVIGRLDDARFFWEEDRKRALASRIGDLAKVTFHRKVGSYADKSRSVRSVAGLLARQIGLAPIDVEKLGLASDLCKADLVTSLVGEFPELQGVVGGLLLRTEGGDPIVADAIADQYKPAGADDALPRTEVGCALAVADRVDTITTLLKAGESVTGSRDPFGLRRAANGTFRIALERRWPIGLHALVATHEQSATLETFWKERLANFLVDEGFTTSEVAAVLHTGDSGEPLRWPFYSLVERLQALRSVRDREDFRTLLLLTKRINNIVPQVDALEARWLEDGWLPSPPSYEDYEHPEPAARALRKALFETQERVGREAESGDYSEVMSHLAALADPVARFFDEVLVIDEAGRDDTHHRKELVARLAGLLTRYFDIRELAGQADSKR